MKQRACAFEKPEIHDFVFSISPLPFLQDILEFLCALAPVTGLTWTST